MDALGLAYLGESSDHSVGSSTSEDNTCVDERLSARQTCGSVECPARGISSSRLDGAVGDRVNGSQPGCFPSAAHGKHHSFGSGYVSEARISTTKRTHDGPFIQAERQSRVKRKMSSISPLPTTHQTLLPPQLRRGKQRRPNRVTEDRNEWNSLASKTRRRVLHLKGRDQMWAQRNGSSPSILPATKPTNNLLPNSRTSCVAADEASNDEDCHRKRPFGLKRAKR
jgi:hypothetical protein